MTQVVPKVVDNDRDEITAVLDGREIRGWSYANEQERRVKMLAAREFCEGWFQAIFRTTPDEHQCLHQCLRCGEMIDAELTPDGCEHPDCPMREGTT